MENQRSIKAKVSAKGWIVIPAPLRRKFSIKPGDIVELKEEKGQIAILPVPESPVEELHGKLACDFSLSEDLLKERAEELKDEEARFHP